MFFHVCISSLLLFFFIIPIPSTDILIIFPFSLIEFPLSLPFLSSRRLYFPLFSPFLHPVLYPTFLSPCFAFAIPSSFPPDITPSLSLPPSVMGERERKKGVVRGGWVAVHQITLIIYQHSESSLVTKKPSRSTRRRCITPPVNGNVYHYFSLLPRPAPP